MRSVISNKLIVFVNFIELLIDVGFKLTLGPVYKERGLP